VEGLATRLDRPHPPGEYSVVVVGSGPGGLQTSYCLTRLGVPHAVISRDDSPGGMFREFPVFQRLLSWTQVDAVAERATREYEWYDHNSLVADEPENRALVARELDRSWIVPTRQEMERGLAAFAEQTAIRVRYGCEWLGTRREEDTWILETSDGDYRARAVVFALGVTEPWKSDIAGVEDVPHYGETRPREEYAGKDVIVVGKRNSAFELAEGLEPWARTITLISPRPVDTSVLALSTVRARYMQPIEVHQYGGPGGTFALDASIERIERRDGGYHVLAHGTTTPGALEVGADEAIVATGFLAPVLDLPSHGLSMVAQGKVPALTPYWEGIGTPGLYFAGNATQGAAGLRKNGVFSVSAAVHGFRYNARVLARHVAETHAGLAPVRPELARADGEALLVRELARAPELWAQKSYLARVVSFADGAARDEGVQPLAHFVDASGPDAVAAAIEMDERANIRPIVYVRRGGEVAERPLTPDALHRYEREETRRELAAALVELR
jgi:thioredoxin reductase